MPELSRSEPNTTGRRSKLTGARSRAWLGCRKNTSRRASSLRLQDRLKRFDQSDSLAARLIFRRRLLLFLVAALHRVLARLHVNRCQEREIADDLFPRLVV